MVTIPIRGLASPLPAVFLLDKAQTPNRISDGVERDSSRAFIRTSWTSWRVTAFNARLKTALTVTLSHGSDPEDVGFFAEGSADLTDMIRLMQRQCARATDFPWQRSFTPTS